MNKNQAMELLAGFVGEHFHTTIRPDALSPIHQGASGRLIVRIGQPAPCIAIYWTDERPDNMGYVPVCTALNEAGVPVPAILASHTGPHDGMALVEDLGDDNLLAMKAAAWEHKKPYYVSALRDVHRLHQSSIPDGLELQPPFDEDMYRWEQAYFAEHFIGRLKGGDPSSFLNHPACRSMAARLAGLARMPVHRDFQSQNIHIRDGRTWLIDFQGMRMGRPEYDLASLVYDPYMQLDPAEQEELLAAWENICSTPLDRDILAMCALQRLMQATGAFAKFSLAGNAWYAGMIQPALASLAAISATSLLAEPLSAVVE